MSDDQTIMIPYPSGGSVPVPSRIDRADFVDKIKPEHVVEVIRHKLLGEEWNGSTWVKVPALQANSLSDAGAWEVANLMLGGGSINMSISKITKEQIKARLKAIIKELMIKMLSSWRSYKINDVGQFYYVKSIVFSNALAVLSQAGDGSIQELFKTTVQENRNISSEKKEPGKLRRMLGMS